MDTLFILSFSSLLLKSVFMSNETSKNSASAIQRQAREFVERKRREAELAKENAERLLKLRLQSDNVRHIHSSCTRIESMLEQLQKETKSVDPMRLMDQVSAANRAAAVLATKTDESEEVIALRAFASDDTTLETNSVADYSSDPPSAPLFSNHAVSDCVSAINESIQKIKESNDILSKIVKENPQWWNNAIVMRRTKTHCIRTNYHARKVRLWGDQCRSHLFVSSSIVNRVASDSTAELRELKLRLGQIESRKASLQESSRLLDEEHSYLQEMEKQLTAALAECDDTLLAVGERQQLVRKASVSPSLQGAPSPGDGPTEKGSETMGSRNFRRESLAVQFPQPSSSTATVAVAEMFLLLQKLTDSDGAAPSMANNATTPTLLGDARNPAAGRSTAAMAVLKGLHASTRGA